MGRYILKRILVSIPVILGMAFLTFLLMRMSPGNFLDTMRMDPQISADTIAHYERIYQLDKPLLFQYFYWLKNLVSLEFGYSFYYNIPVTKVIGGRLFNTFVLSLASFLFTWAIAIALGIWAAFRDISSSTYLAVPSDVS